MQHRVRRSRKKLGWPEAWLVCSIALAIVPATVWWRQHYKPEWKQTTGQITSSELSNMHYNAETNRTKAKVSYEYTVGMAKYMGHFDGYWPAVGSPNALAPSEIEKLTEPKKELIVFYNPANAARSELHQGSGKASPFWLVLAAAGLCIAGVYTFLVYPAWRA
jgi:hypothetical protein